MRYIELKNKKPIDTLDNYLSLEKVEKAESYGRILENKEVVIDIDSAIEAEKLLEIVKSEKINTKVYKTKRGMHFLFTIDTKIKNFIKASTPIGVTVDIKCGINNSYQILKLNGEVREIIYDTKSIDKLPIWLMPFNHITDYIDLKDGDGRNDALFRSIIPMATNKMTKEEIEKTLTLVNKHMFAQPLGQEEISAMLDNNSIFENRKLTFYEGRKLMHNVLADYIIDKHSCKYFNGSIYIYTDKGYTCNMKQLEYLIYSVIPDITTNSIKEVIHYMDVHLSMNESEISKHYIQVLNGLVNLYTGEFCEFNRNIFTTISIPVYFNSKAPTSEIEKALMLYADNNEEIYELLLEFIAYTFFQKNKFRKMFMLYGVGSNGKSKYTAIIENFIGKTNVSALSLEDMNHRFKVSALVDSKCNIGNDIGAKLLDDSQMIKKLTGEDTINADRKNRDPIEFECTTKLIFSCNKLPRANDKSYGFYNRFVIIPFTFDFDNYNGSSSFSISEFCNVENMSALLNLVISRYKRLIDNGKFTKSQKVVENLISYMSYNDGIAKWFFSRKDKETDAGVTELYNEYQLFCSLNRQTVANSLTFIENYTNLLKTYKNIIKD